MNLFILGAVSGFTVKAIIDIIKHSGKKKS